jgi:hypothetical protein
VTASEPAGVRPTGRPIEPAAGPASCQPTAVTGWSFPLTPLERFLLDCQTPSNSMTIRVIMRMRGHADLSLLCRAIEQATLRHPLLRSRLCRQQGKAVWVSESPAPPLMGTRNEPMPLSGMFTPIHHFRLAEAPGFLARILQWSDGISVCLDAHHAVTAELSRHGDRRGDGDQSAGCESPACSGSVSEAGQCRACQPAGGGPEFSGDDSGTHVSLAASRCTEFLRIA